MELLQEQRQLNNKFLILVIILISVFGCQLKVTDDGNKSTSINSKISKEKDVFISYYSVSPRVFKSPSGKIYHIEEVFSEWKYDVEHSGVINKWDDSQLVIRFKDTIDNYYNLNWKLGSEFDELYFLQGTGNFMLHGGMEIVENIDSFSVSIVNSAEQDTTKSIIGRLDFTK